MRKRRESTRPGRRRRSADPARPSLFAGVRATIAVSACVGAVCFLVGLGVGQWMSGEGDSDPFRMVGQAEWHAAAIEENWVDHKFAFAGLPIATESEAGFTLLRYDAFVIGYSEDRKAPLWAAYKLEHVLQRPPVREVGNFRIEHRTNSKVSEDDYTKTGYDRGHLAPNYAIAACYGPDAQYDTYYMANVVPQKPQVNRKLWRVWERKVFDDFTARFGDIWVVAGPIFGEDPPTIGPGVAVPEAFFKVLIDEDEDRGIVRTLAIIIPAEATGQQFSRYLTTIDEVEARTGLDFAHLLDDQLEEALESSRADAAWNVDDIPLSWWDPTW